MWRNVPHGTSADIARVCAPFLDRYFEASVAGDINARAEALLDLCLLSRQLLRRAGGRGGDSGLRAFRRQLQHAIKSPPTFGDQVTGSGAALGEKTARATEARAGTGVDDEETQRRIARATPHYLADHLSRAATTLVQPAPLPITDDTLTQLKALHPPKSADLPALPDNTPVTIAAADPDALLRQIRREASKAAAPGTTGWTADHVLAMWGDERGQRGVCRLITDILNGDLTDHELELINASRLHAIPKPSGKGVRPIAVGEIFYRLAGCVRNATIAANVPSLFPSIQYGVGIRGGAEKAVHKIRVAFDKHGSDAVVIRTDFTNAYNSRRRDRMFQELFAMPKVAGLWRGLRAAYESGAPLYVYDNGRLVGVLCSEEGARQGCPNGGFLYSLSVQKFLEIVAGPDTGRVTVVAYVDDTTIIAPWRDALNAFRRMQEGSKKDDMALNVDKCYLFWRYRQDPPEELVAECAKIGLAIRRDYVEMLGSRIYADDDVNDEKARKWALEFVKADSIFFDAITHKAMPGQMAHRLLTTCGVPKANYRARTIPPRIFDTAAREFDRRAANAFLTRLDTTLDKLPALARTQISLPRRLGGLGLRSMERTSAAAYVAAVADSIGTDIAPHLQRIISSSSATTAARQQPAAPVDADSSSTRARAQRIVDAAAASAALADVVKQVDELPRFAWDAVDAMKRVMSHRGDLSSDTREPEGRWVLDAVVGLRDLIATQSSDDSSVRDDHLQRTLTRGIEQSQHDMLTGHSEKDKARLLSLQQKHALDWLSAPANRPEYRIRDPYFGLAVRHMLGLPPLADDDAAVADELPHHGCRCLKPSARASRSPDTDDEGGSDTDEDTSATSSPTSPSRRSQAQPPVSSHASRLPRAHPQSAASAAQRQQSSSQQTRSQQRVNKTAEPDHLAVCLSNRNVGVLQRHNHIVLMLAKLFDQAGVYKRIEPRHTMDAASTRKNARPDVEATGAIHSATLAVDVTVPHPTAATYVTHAACHAGSAAAKAEAIKRRKYDPLVAEVRAATGAKVDFVPLVLESYGAPGESVDKIVQWMASEAATMSPMRVDFPTAKSFSVHAYRTLSVALQVGNAQMYVTGLRQNGRDTAVLARARASHIYAGG